MTTAKAPSQDTARDAGDRAQDCATDSAAPVPTSEEITEEWNARARRDGLARVMRARQPEEIAESVTDETRRLLDRLLRRAGRESGAPLDRVLEVGCGIGRLTPVIAARARMVDALDMTPGMLEAARRNCAGLDNVTLRLGRAQDLPLRDQDTPPADVAVCVWVLMHILDEDELAGVLSALAASARYLVLVEYEHAHVPVGRFSRLRPLEHFLALLPGGARVVERHELTYGGDRSFAVLIDLGTRTEPAV